MIQIDKVSYSYIDIDGKEMKVFRIKSDDDRINGYVLDYINSSHEKEDIRSRLISDIHYNFEAIKEYLYRTDEILSNDRRIMNHKLKGFLKMVEREYKMNEIGI